MKRSHIEISKRVVGERAVEFVRDGMILGLGTGTTVRYFIEKLAEKIKRESLEIIAIPTSIETEKLAERLGIPLSTLDKYPEVDLDIDGADEVDPEFNLIKGRGGAHSMEKRVASASERFIVIVDYTKIVKNLGGSPVPIEVLPEFIDKVEKKLRGIGGIPELRKGFTTDNGNLILDTRLRIEDPLDMEIELNSIPGVVDNGIFSKRRPDIVIIGKNKRVEILKRK